MRGGVLAPIAAALQLGQAEFFAGAAALSDTATATTAKVEAGTCAAMSSEESAATLTALLPTFAALKPAITAASATSSGATIASKFVGMLSAVALACAPVLALGPAGPDPRSSEAVLSLLLGLVASQLKTHV